MDLDRPHFRSASINSTSELLICFASGLTSSSSMKFSKSILSPGRARDGSISLSTSLSRRLRNGSLKGGQASPFLASKKRGSGFENPEPSSPKVTCIGQVRVKTKKKVKQTRKGNGEAGVHQIEERICSAHHHQQQDRNQRWVHLPVTICESLSCLFPCKSSCFSTSEREKVEKLNGSRVNEDEHISCGAVFTKWFVSLNDGEGGRRREIELVMDGGDDEEKTEVREKMSMRSSRRHVFEDIKIKDDRIEVNGQLIDGEEEEAAARVSICLPPKNALLLMRCRSDPMKMDTLANRFSWDANAAPRNNEDEEDEDVEEQVDVDQCQVQDQVLMVKEQNVRVSIDFDEEQEILLRQEIFDLVMNMAACEEEEVEKEPEALVQEGEEVESSLDQENTENSENFCPVHEKEQEEDSPISHSSPSTESDTANSEEVAIVDEAASEKSQETEAEESKEENPTTAQLKFEPDDKEQKRVSAISIESEAKENENQETTIAASEKDKENPRLPECLLLMMCEPKLSMEVSKETWVCKTDFIRWLPERPPKKPTNGGTCDHEPIKKRLSTDSKLRFIAPPAAEKKSENNLQPRRSSCTLPATAAASIATVIEKKLVNTASYEPVELTRCKSEPMKTAAAKLMPESCFWKNALGKLEPHRGTTVGAGAGGVEL